VSYAEFIANKRHSIGNSGFTPVWMPDSAFDFQQAIIERAVRKGRLGLFCDTGLGKTMIELSIAENVIRQTNKRVLILTPLAVAFQFLDEAARIGVTDIAHSKNGELKAKIIVCNYERLHLLNASDFECVICDESSILKNFAGKIRDQIVLFVRQIRYRFLATATPSPNDFIELGNSSEALGYMGYMDMLSKFFKSTQGSADSNNRNIGEKFYLKPHAERDFFAWVNQWCVMVKKPSDIGFSDDHYALQPLVTNNHVISNRRNWEKEGQGSLFAVPAITMPEMRDSQKMTITDRCELSARLAHGKTSVY